MDIISEAAGKAAAILKTIDGVGDSEEEVKGNKKAKEWIKVALPRLKTAPGKKLGRALVATHPDSWWFDVKDKWFVDRKAQDRGWRKKSNKK